MKNNWAYIALAVALVVVTVFIWDSPPTLLLPDIEPLDESDLIPYAVMDEAHSKHFGVDGALSYEFSAVTLKHFRLDLGKISTGDFTTLEQPLLTLYTENDAWYVSAKLARVTEQGSLLKLWQDVRVWQEQDDGQTLELTTDEILIYPTEKLVKTDSAVNIQSPMGSLNAIGMVVDLDKKNIKLLNNVHGSHDPI